MLEGEPNFILRSNFHHILVDSATIFKLLKKKTKKKQKNKTSLNLLLFNQLWSAGPPSFFVVTLITVKIL